jgi:prepilin peptidase CpaA
MLIDVIRLLLFPALMAFAASSDLLTMTISNRLSLALAGGFFLLTIATSMSLAAVGMHLAAGALVLAICFGFFSAGWIGGGDAKLFAGVALWLGWPACFAFLMVTALAGGGLALLLLNARSTWLKPYLAGAPPWLDRLTTTGQAVPYGAAIALGALAAFPQSSLMRGLHISF